MGGAIEGGLSKAREGRASTAVAAEVATADMGLEGFAAARVAPISLFSCSSGPLDGPVGASIGSMDARRARGFSGPSIRLNTVIVWLGVIPLDIA